MIRDEECFTKHKLLVWQINLRTQIRKQLKLLPKIQKPEIQEKYEKTVGENINSSTMLSDLDSEADVKSIWMEIKSCLMNTCDSSCGWMKGNGK